MGRNASRQLVIVAQLTGTCAGHCLGKRYTREEAEAEIAGILANARIKPGSEQAVALLSHAASLYLEPTGPGDEFWYPGAVALLVELGADLERARVIHEAGRGRSATVR